MSDKEAPVESANESGGTEDQAGSQAQTSRDVAAKPEEVTNVSRHDRLPQSIVEEFTGIAQFGPMHHPIFSKFEPEHVTQFLANVREREQDESHYKKGGRWFRLAYVLTGIGVFVFLTLLLLPDQSDLYFQILEYVGIFAAGFAGGYGIKTYMDRTRD